MPFGKNEKMRKKSSGSTRVVGNKKRVGVRHYLFVVYFSSISVELYLGLPDLVETDRSSVDAVRGDDRPP